jgi:hypothetical protein
MRCSEYAQTIVTQCVQMLPEVVEADPVVPFARLYVLLLAGSFVLVASIVVKHINR